MKSTSLFTALLFGLLAVPWHNPLRGQPQQNVDLPSLNRSGTGNVSALLPPSTNVQPLFVENNGQWNPEARYLCRRPGLDMWLTPSGFVFDYYQVQGEKGTETEVERLIEKILNPLPHLQKTHRTGQVVRMTFEGANSTATVLGEEISGADFAWITRGNKAITGRGAARGRIANIYPGIDALAYIDNGTPRYDLVVGPGSDPAALRIRFDGAEQVRVTPQGTLALKTSLGEQLHEGLFAYQVVDGRQHKVSAAFRQVGANRIGFALGTYDKSRPLIIDPIITGTYLGGGGSESIFPEVDFGLLGRITSGTLHTDSRGNILIAGSANSANFPTTTGAYDETLNGSIDGVVALLNGTTGALVSATYFGGSNIDIIHDACFTPDGSVWVCGSTTSTNLPITENAFQPTYGTADNLGRGFVAKFSQSLSTLSYSSYVNAGTATRTLVQSIRVDGSSVWFAGGTQGANLPTTANAYATSANLDASEATVIATNLFLGRINDGTLNLDYLTYINEQQNQQNEAGTLLREKGGADGNRTAAVACTSSVQGVSADFPFMEIADDGSVLIAAHHFSGPMPITANAWQSTRFTTTAERGGWLGKFDATGTTLLYGTFFGSPTSASMTSPFGVIGEPDGGITVVGRQTGTVWETTPDAFDETPNGIDGFLFRLKPDGDVLFSTLIGGTGTELILSSPVRDNCGRYVLPIFTTSADFPVTPNAANATNNGADAGIAVISPNGDSLLYATYLGGTGFESHPIIAVNGEGIISGILQTTSTTLVTTPNGVQSSSTGGSEFYYFKLFPDEIWNLTLQPETLRIDCANRQIRVRWDGGKGVVGCTPGYEVVVEALDDDGDLIPLDTVNSADGAWNGEAPAALTAGTYSIVLRHRGMNIPFDTSGTFVVETGGGGREITDLHVPFTAGNETILCPDEGVTATWAFNPQSRPCLQGKLIRFEFQREGSTGTTQLGTALYTDARFSGLLPRQLDTGRYRLLAYDAETGALLGKSNVTVLSEGILSGTADGEPLRHVAFPVTPSRSFRDTTLIITNPSLTCPLIIDGGTLRFESGDIAVPAEFVLMEALPNTPRDQRGDWILAPGDVDSIRVRFQPVRGGSRRATMRIATNRRSTLFAGVTSPGEFYWDFFGVGSVGIEFGSPDNLPRPVRFDPIIVGGAPDTKMMQLENTSSESLTITGITFDNPAFAFAPGSTGLLPATLKPGARFQADLIHQAPVGTTPGLKKGLATITLAGGQTLTVDLEGIAGTRELSGTPGRITINAPQGETARGIVVLANTGTLPVTIFSTSLKNGSPDLTLRTAARQIIEPGAFEFVEITFIGTGREIADTLLVFNNATNGPLRIAINGLSAGTEAEGTNSPTAISSVPTTGEQNGPTLYPNPAYERTSIVWNVPQGSYGRAGIYDLSGQLIREAGVEEMRAGELRFDLRSMPAGLYFVRLNSTDGSNETITLPLTIVR